MKGWLAFGCIVLSVILACYVFFGDRIVWSFSEQEVYEKIEPQLSLVIEKTGMTIVVTEIIPTFLQSNRVHLYTTFTVSGWGITGNGKGEIVTGIEYKDGDFFAKDVELNQFDLTDIQSNIQQSDQVIVGKHIFQKFKDKMVGD